MIRRAFLTLASLLFVIPSGTAQEAADAGWPRKLDFDGGAVVIYQPQVESLTENHIESRAAVSVTTTANPEPVFGAVWLTADLQIDRDQRQVAFTDIRVPRVRFVDASDEDKEKLARYLEREIPKWGLVMDLDRLIPELELAEQDAADEAGLKHDPPKIVVVSEPTTLVVIDGEPRLQAVTSPKDAVKKKIERVVNTPVLLVHYPKKKTFYLAGGGDLWYAASEILGPFAPVTKVPKAVRLLVEEGESEEDETTDGEPPNVIVATVPTEIIVVAGEPEYAPLGDLDLLVMANADRDVIVDMATNDHYVLLSGRWYVSAEKLAGPWRFTPPTDLPGAFAEIPADSDRAYVRAHVPGTTEAQEALLDNSIPQTTAVKRNDSSFKAQYDGEPKFKKAEEADVQYAVNSPQSVFKYKSRYYACEQAVWYESNSATGPWSVATEIPEAIYDLSPANPHHNVTYVKVYDVTPEVVYVGYTPGYVGSYAYGGCVVYGTGWYYPGWYGRYYYPRPYTWGFHATYNPWYGWGFGISWSSGPLTVSIGRGGWGYHSWWGPGGYRPYYPPYRPPYHPGYRPPYYPGYRPPHHPGHRPPGYRPPAGGTRPPTTQPLPGSPAQLPGASARPADARPGTNNLYARDGNATRNATRPSTMDRSANGSPTTRPNNVYTDRSGNVYRRNEAGGWEQRQGGDWKPSTGGGSRPGAERPSTRPSTGQPTVRPSTPQTRPGGAPSSLNRDYGARSRGQSRSQQYHSAPRPTAPRSGMSRGGGARRR